jgi:restriction system protein
VVARRKSLVAQVLAAHQKAKLERERAQRQYEADARNLQAQLEKEAAQQEREEERAAQVQLRQRQQEQRRAAAQQREQERQQAQAQREQERQQAQAQREEQRQAAEKRRQAGQQQAAEAELKTEAIHQAEAALSRLLHDRSRSLAMECRAIEEAFNADGSDALVAALQHALATSVYPEGLRGSCAAMYRPEARELLIEYELPRHDAVPVVAGYRYVKSKDLVQPEPRKETQTRRLYSELLARITLRTLAEAFDAAPATLITGIVFNGYVSAKDRMTGKPVRPLLISVHAIREAFAEIVLDEPELDPAACLRGYLNAIVSPHPYDLEPVRPVVQFDLSKYKFVEEMDIVAGLDSRTDLLALKPVEFGWRPESGVNRRAWFRLHGQVRRWL